MPDVQSRTAGQKPWIERVAVRDHHASGGAAPFIPDGAHAMTVVVEFPPWPMRTT